jgi:hypothetical protein
MALDFDAIQKKMHPDAKRVLRDANALAGHKPTTSQHLSVILVHWAADVQSAAVAANPSTLRAEFRPKNPAPWPYRAYLDTNVRRIITSAYFIAAEQGPDRLVEPWHLLVSWIVAEVAITRDNRSVPGNALLHAYPYDIENLMDTRQLSDVILDLRAAAERATDATLRDALLLRADRLRKKLS